MTTHWRLEDGVLSAGVEGRLGEAEVEMFAVAIDEVLAAHEQVCVLFDRRQMGAPTTEGRRALEAWAATALPLLADRCLAWADVLPAKALAALQRREAARDGDEHQHPYPQRSFDDPGAAHTWIREQQAAAVGC